MDLAPNRLICFITSLSLVVICLATSLHAGIIASGNRSVGGVMIDGAGVVRTATPAEQQEFADLVRQGLDPLKGDLREAAEMRMISLKGLQQAITESMQSGAMVPDEVEFLAGLQRIEYVFVDEDEQRHHHRRTSRTLGDCATMARRRNRHRWLDDATG